jgi:hypothetical protein
MWDAIDNYMFQPSGGHHQVVQSDDGHLSIASHLCYLIIRLVLFMTVVHIYFYIVVYTQRGCRILKFQTVVAPYMLHGRQARWTFRILYPSLSVYTVLVYLNLEFMQSMCIFINKMLE